MKGGVVSEIKAREEIAYWAKEMHARGIVGNGKGCLSMRMDERILVTPEAADFSDFSAGDVVLVNPEDFSYGDGSGSPDSFYRLHAALYKKRKDFNVLVHSFLPNTVTSSRAGREVLPLLDDLAQIVGPTVKIVGMNGKSEKALNKKMLKAMKWRSGVMLEGQGAICGALGFDDVQAVAQVLEKGCKTFIETEFLGGGKRINFVEAHLMRLVYNLKYSKQDAENR